MEPENIIPISVKLVNSGKEILFEYKKTNLLLDASFLRAASPSAENKKHAKNPNRERFIDVKITNIEKVGRYALKFIFNDGHDTGIYSWEYIIKIAKFRKIL
tara:strand:+ start:607 stop:912 length:306 start_codon:yes stop_codon:yes gene_type:complete